MGQWIDDLRYAARRLWQQPGFTLVAAATLALGLGANIAIFTLVYGITYQPLPVRAPHELVRLGDNNNCCVNSGLQDRYSLFSNHAYEHLRQGLTQFASLTAFQASPQASAVRRAGHDIADSVNTQYVTATYFQTLGVQPAMGRLLQPDDDRSDASPVFVMSHKLWRDKYASDPAVMGAAFTIGGHVMTLVGVSEPSFFGETRQPNMAEIWLPMGQEAPMRTAGSLIERSGTDWLRVIGRMRSGQSRDSVETTATTLMRQWLQSQTFLTDNNRARIGEIVVPAVSAEAGVEIMRFGFQQQLLVLFGMSGFVLLVATANLANLLLARADRGQAAIRIALGAPGARLIRQSLVEGVVLALVGALAGLGIASAATRVIVSLAFPNVAALPIDLSPSGPVLMFAALLAILTSALFSAAPALAMSRVPPMDALRGAGRSGESKSVVPRRALVVTQVALSFVLLAGAGLLSRSLSLLETQRLGFEPQGRLVARLEIPASYGGDVPRLEHLYRSLRERVERLSGVRRMTYALYTPMEGNNWSGTIAIEGIDAPADQSLNSSWNRVAPDFFDVVGTRVMRGRAFTGADSPSAPRVAVVNQTFVDQFFDQQNPIGRRLGLGATRDRDYEIVGVVEDAKFSNAHLATRPMIFLPDFQLVDFGPPANMTSSALGQVSTQARSTLMRMLVLEMSGTASSLEGDLRRTLAQVDPNLSLVRLLPMDAQVAGNFRINRLLARLTSAYGLLALALATLGLYAVTSYQVTQKRREIGVRMALGADRGRVIREIVRGALVQTAIGLMIGVPATVFAARAISAQLYGVTANDPRVLGGAVAVLLLAAVGSAAWPARRAASVDPTKALRGD